MAKAPGLVCRLAITIHLLRWTEGLADDRKFIDAASLDAAIAIFERFCRPMYERVCAAFGQVQAHEGASRIADLIKRKKLDKIRVGDVTKLDWQGCASASPSSRPSRPSRTSIGCAGSRARPGRAAAAPPTIGP